MKPKIALVTPYTFSHRTAEETLALGYLASVLRNNGYPVVIVDAWLRGISASEVIDEISSGGDPAIICLSCYPSNLEQGKEILDLAKQRFNNLPSICGGYGPTFHTEDFLNAGFDFAVLGEAEHMIVSLIEQICAEKEPVDVSGIAYKKNGTVIVHPRSAPITDLDTLPFPSRDEIRFTLERKNPVHMSTSRGCEGHCLFCSIFAFAKGGGTHKRWRQRSINNIVEEIKFLHDEYGVSDITFVDDSFIEYPRDEAWTKKFSDAILSLGFPVKFRTQVRADRLSRQIVENLSRAGWFCTSVGVENVSETALARMGKMATVADNTMAVEILHEFGVFCLMGLILFDSGTMMKELEENYQFLKEHPWVIIFGLFTEMFAAEGTALARKRGRKNISATKKQYHEGSFYEVKDPQVKRVYSMIKTWSKTHSDIYDWAYDAISAPKVLPEEGYADFHEVCVNLLNKDLEFFRFALDCVSEKSSGESEAVADFVEKEQHFFDLTKQKVGLLYSNYGLTFDCVYKKPSC